MPGGPGDPSPGQTRSTMPLMDAPIASPTLRHGRVNWLLLTLGALALMCLCCGGGVFYCSRNAMPMAGCLITYSLAEQAISEYARKHDGNLPPAANWQSELAPYYTKYAAKADTPKGNPFVNIEIADITKPLGCYDGSRATSGMAYNTEVAGKKLHQIKDRTTPIFFEVPTASLNQAMKYAEQDVSKAPTMFGQSRGWFLVTVDGQTLMLTKDGRTPVNVGTGSTTPNGSKESEANAPATSEEGPM